MAEVEDVASDAGIAVRDKASVEDHDEAPVRIHRKHAGLSGHCAARLQATERLEIFALDHRPG